MNAATCSLLAIALTLSSASPGDTFQDAKQAYGDLRGDKKRRVQRVPYEKLMKQLVAASKAKGDKAEECLFFAATIAEDLYTASGVASDLEDAVRLNVDVADRFPSSSLGDDALLRAARLTLSRKGDRDGARALLARAKKDFPRGDQARAVDELFSRLPAAAAPEKSAVVVNAAPVKEEAKPAREDTQARIQDILARVAADAAKQDAGVETRMEVSVAPPPPPPVAAVEAANALRFGKLASGKDGSTLVLEVDGQVNLVPGTVPAAKGAPHRFFVDVSPATTGNVSKALKGLKDARILGARVAQFDGVTVRVVIELKSAMQGVAVMDAPGHRILIHVGRPQVLATPPVLAKVEVAPAKGVVEAAAQDEDDHAPVEEHPTPQNVVTRATADAGPSLSDVKELAKDFKDRGDISLSAQAGLKVRRVVIDAGHGGHDTGAIGPNGVREKDVTLKIARKVAARLRKELKMEVVLTRDKDEYLALEERTQLANKAHADLFISIHCNSNPNQRIHGIETYYLNITDDNYAMRLAARENRSSARTVSDLQFILADLAMKSNVDDSVRLSKLVQTNVVGELREGYPQVKDLGVKHALFYVLIGARMPAILVETSFVSNKMEEQRLKSDKYQEDISDGVVQGVRHFMEERQALAR